MAASYDDCYDSSWHLIPPDYVCNEDDYRQVHFLFLVFLLISFETFKMWFHDF